MATEARPTSGVVSDTVLSTYGMLVQGVVRFGYTWLIGNVLGKIAMGQVNTLLSVAVWASLCWPAAAGIVAARRLHDEGVDEAEVLSTAKRSVWRAVPVLVLLGTGLAWLLVDDPALALTTAGVVAGYACYVFVRATMVGQGRLRAVAAWDTGSAGVAVVLLAAVVFGGVDWLLLVPLTIGYALFAWAGWPRSAHPDATLEDRRRSTHLATRQTSLALLATGGLLPATMIFVQAFDDPVTAGAFAAGLSLATPLNLVSQALNQVLVPHYAALRRVGLDAARRRQAAVLLASGGLFAAGFGLLIALAGLVLGLFFPGYEEGVLPMQMLLAIVFFMSVVASPTAYLLAVDRADLNARIWLAALVAGVVVMAVAAPAWGQWGAMLGYAVGAIGGAIAVVVASFVVRPGLGPETA